MNHSLLTCSISLIAALAACTPREQTTDDAGPAPVDTAASAPIDTVSAPMDTAVTVPVDSTLVPDTSAATPPITPPQSSTPLDTPPAGAEQRTGGAQSGKITQTEYEGWRQYSVNCARCHGQDVLPNPVAANLLVSAGPGGPMASEEKFVQVVSEGRPDRGMPAFKSLLSPSQNQAIYAYVKGRADKRIPPGRPEPPAG
jgi:mono/diheme cytochrome c family protein